MPGSEDCPAGVVSSENVEAVTDRLASVTVTPHDENLRPDEVVEKRKRSEPFQFGSRFLGEDDDVFEFNAWDHVETDDAFKEYAEKQFEMQRQSPVSDFDKSRSPCLCHRLALFEDTSGSVMIYVMHSSSEYH